MVIIGQEVEQVSIWKIGLILKYFILFPSIGELFSSKEILEILVERIEFWDIASSQKRSNCLALVSKGWYFWLSYENFFENCVVIVGHEVE